MRVSNDTFRSAFLAALDAAQKRVLHTQEQVSTGKRVNVPSDDPVAAARVAHLDASLSRLDQYQSNTVLARNQLGLEEESLQDVLANLQSIRELALQANNSTTSDADRRIIAGEIRQYRESLLALANTTDAEGSYLFSGYAQTATPFSIGTGGTVVYNGDQGQRSVQISDGRFVAVNDSGAEVFQRIPEGNGTFVADVGAGNTGTGTLGAATLVDPSAWVADTYTLRFLTATTYEVRNSANALITSGTFTPPSQSIAFRGVNVEIDGAPAANDTFTVRPSGNRDIFATLDDLIASLEAPAASAAQRAQLHSDVGQRLVDLDSALSHVTDVRGDIGARLRALDQQESLNADFNVHLNTTLSAIRDLDYSEAVSRLSQELFGLDAAQQTFARAQNLSLFKYL